jgi:putative SOS response-associated peptidase YedK
MCGRYSITVGERTLEERFGAKFIFGHFEPAYNAAPSQLLPIIRTYAQHEIIFAKWGFKPEGWNHSRKYDIKPQINARVATASA